MTSILDSSVQSLGEYVRLKREQQALEQQPDLKKKHKYLVPARPTECPACSAQDSFWVKAYFFRWAVEAELEEVLPVPRYICKWCGLVVSVLFAFLVPYRQMTAATVGKAVQEYLVERTSYRAVAGAVSGSSDKVQRPNHSQVWRWVELFAGKAAAGLNARLQRACIQYGKESGVGAIHETVCPNACMASTPEKTRKLNSGTRLVGLVRLLLERSENVVAELQACFAIRVQPACSILTGRGVSLFTPQSSHHLIW
jgi:hypothetical protein